MSQREDFERALSRYKRLELFIRANADEAELPTDDLIWFLDNDDDSNKN